MQYIPAFLITMASIIVMGFAAAYIIREMIMTNIDGVTGTLALGMTLVLMATAILSREPLVGGAIFVITITLLVGYPFAEKQLSQQVGRELNAKRIEQTHAALSSRPDNTAAWLALAEAMWRHGWQGHAIATAEQVLNQLNSNQDPFQNRSVRDIFLKEDLRLKEWKRRADLRLCQSLKCPLCGAENAPGLIACCRCGKPYLLELSRRTDVRSKFIKKLILGWLLLAVILVGGAVMGLMIPFPGSVMAVIGSVFVAGFILWRLFAPPRGDATSSPLDWD